MKRRNRNAAVLFSPLNNSSKSSPSVPRRCRRSAAARTRSAPPRTRCYCRRRCPDLRHTEAELHPLPAPDTAAFSESQKATKKKTKRTYARLRLIFAAATFIEKCPETESQRDGRLSFAVARVINLYERNG